MSEIEKNRQSIHARRRSCATAMHTTGSLQMFAFCRILLHLFCAPISGRCRFCPQTHRPSLFPVMNNRLFYDQSCGKHQSDRIVWRNHRSALHEIPDQVRPWLLDESSLTRHLQHASQQHFGVQVLWQHWARPLPDEQHILNLPVREVAQLRETLLLVDGVPWVFARSIIPVRSLTGANRRLRHLGNQSLGSWLFQSRSLRRSQFQVARIPSDNPILPAREHSEHSEQGECSKQTLWGRRSRFEVDNKPLLVCEIFLGNFRPWTVAGQHHRLRG